MFNTQVEQAMRQEVASLFRKAALYDELWVMLDRFLGTRGLSVFMWHPTPEWINGGGWVIQYIDGLKSGLYADDGQRYPTLSLALERAFQLIEAQEKSDVPT